MKRKAHRSLAKATDAVLLAQSFLGVSIRSLKFRVDPRDVNEERLQNLLEEIAVLKRVGGLLTRVDVLIDEAILWERG